MSNCNTDNFNYFWICEPLAQCAKQGSSLPLGTPMEIDCTSAYLHYPLPQCSKIVTPIIFSISYELFRLPSAKVPQDYQLLRTFVWCLMEKLTRNNEPFLDTFQLSSRRLRKVSMSFLKKHSLLFMGGIKFSFLELTPQWIPRYIIHKMSYWPFFGNRNIIKNYLSVLFFKITGDKPPGRIAYLFSDD